jgi:hypothetical protein
MVTTFSTIAAEVADVVVVLVPPQPTKDPVNRLTAIIIAAIVKIFFNSSCPFGVLIYS